jgi:hypothetical protein
MEGMEDIIPTGGIEAGTTAITITTATTTITTATGIKLKRGREEGRTG